MPKKKNAKKGQSSQLVRIVALVVIVGIFGAVVVFYTLPQLGINLFGGGKKPASTSTRTVSTRTTTTTVKPPETKPVSGVDPQAEKTILQNVKEAIASAGPSAQLSYSQDLFEPFLIQLENREEVERLLFSTGEGIQTLADTTFVSFFDGGTEPETMAWVRMRRYQNQIIELKTNDLLPGTDDMQVLDISQQGILIYKYPEVNEEGAATKPQLYRVLAKPFEEMGRMRFPLNP
ncbi:MAG TPA: hypothetical protein P5560_00445 [Thermotogota bacterium]|nr:hypothetical protein [Thermotogota bacterium]HRW91401.1 hypothetical protein [Thermotogota bacterium]